MYSEKVSSSLCVLFIRVEMNMFLQSGIYEDDKPFLKCSCAELAATCVTIKERKTEKPLSIRYICTLSRCLLCSCIWH